MEKKYFYLFSVLALFCLDINAQSTNCDLNGDGAIDVADVEVLIGAIKNGQSHEYVDLGLPSGVLWATTNVGAESPEDYGDYFAWGEATTQSDNSYSWASYKWCEGSEETLTKYCNKSSYGYNGFTDTKTVLDADDDAATVNWRGDWRMPTSAEFEELINNTTSEWTTRNGVYGRKFTSKTNGNSIFFPAAGSRWDGQIYGAGSSGYYWSSSLYESNLGNARCLSFGSGDVYTSYDYGGRDCGRPVRPVRFVSNYDLNRDSVINQADVEVLIDAIKNAGENAVETHEYVDLGLPSGVLWATTNVGAESPEDYGDYFAWGEATTQSDNSYSWASYKWCEGGSTFLTKYCTNSDYGNDGFTDRKTVLDADDDAATVNWDNGWRMPTVAEFEELYDNTTNEYITQNGVKGRKFTSTSNGNSIFLPAAGRRWGGDYLNAGSNGYYWSSSLDESNPSRARCLYFSSGSVYASDYGNRDYGRSVRPVR